MASFVVDAAEVITSPDRSILNLLLAVAANCWLNLFLFFKRPITNTVERVAEKCGSDRESLRTDYENYRKRSSITLTNLPNPLPTCYARLACYDQQRK